MNSNPERSPNDHLRHAAKRTLDWYALRYVTNELSEQQARRFERRLAMDLSAQEALARAVELVQSTWLAIEREQQLKPWNDEHVEHVGQASRQPPSAASTRRERIWSGRPALLALASSVVLVLASGWMWHRAGSLVDRTTGEEAVVWASLAADTDLGEIDDAGELSTAGDPWENWLVVDDSANGDETGHEEDIDDREDPTFEFEMTDDWITALISLESTKEEGL